MTTTKLTREEASAIYRRGIQQAADGVYPDDEEFRAAVAALGITPERIEQHRQAVVQHRAWGRDLDGVDRQLRGADARERTIATEIRSHDDAILALRREQAAIIERRRRRQSLAQAMKELEGRHGALFVNGKD